MNLSTILAVALGGALGSVGRYAVMTLFGAWLGTAFPWGTMAVNLLGSFAMGALTELGALAQGAALRYRAFLAVGVLGGFTTFSAFSLDAALLIERGDTAGAAVYILASVAFSVGGLFAGLWLVRALV